MKDLIQNARASTARLRKIRPVTLRDVEAADTIAALCTAMEAAQADAARTRNLLKEARKIIRASSSRSITKDWDERATAAIAAQSAQEKS